MRHNPETDYDFNDLKELNAKEWQVNLLKLNPDYCSWGPHEDYMWKTDKHGWDIPQIYKTWKEFGPWKLNDLNEVVNFYFSIERENKKCVSCDGTGYAPEAKKVSDAWYDFDGNGNRWSNNITQDEVQALIDSHRLYDFTHKYIKGEGWKRRSDNYIPTAEEVNIWSKSGMGHDAINRLICVEQRCKRLNIELLCPSCEGKGYIYIKEKAHVSLTLWVLHPRKGCSRGVEITNINQGDLDAVFNFLKVAAKRNANRFSKIP